MHADVSPMSSGAEPGSTGDLVADGTDSGAGVGAGASVGAELATEPALSTSVASVAISAVVVDSAVAGPDPIDTSDELPPQPTINVATAIIPAH